MLEQPTIYHIRVKNAKTKYLTMNTMSELIDGIWYKESI
jgi:hypothetical protein